MTKRLRNKLAGLVKRHYFLLIVAYVISDFWCRIRYRLKFIATRSGTRHRNKNVKESCAYIHEVFADYKEVSGVKRFKGRVAEVGAGDSNGVGVKFVLDGCTEVHLVDRFSPQRDETQQAYIIDVLLENHAKKTGEKIDKKQLISRIKRYRGASSAAEVFFSNARDYDYIVSRAVLEHLYDPLQALSTMIAALNHGGILLHKVDLRDHGLFSIHFHELTFLRLPQFIYRQMTKGSGRPNRVMLDKYVTLLRESKMDFKILITRLVGVGKIIPHLTWEEIGRSKREIALKIVREFKPQMASELQVVPDSSLAVSGFFLVAEKPAYHVAAA